MKRGFEFVDVYAEPGRVKLYGETKGPTAAICLDVDAMYGPLLRRMKDPDASARYAVVVPTAALSAALRVPAWVRESPRIDVYEVDDANAVRQRN